ncbi:hypothetical protein Drorol1_Dr00018931 [Drosera rotundifolia]
MSTSKMGGRHDLTQDDLEAFSLFEKFRNQIGGRPRPPSAARENQNHHQYQHPTVVSAPKGVKDASVAAIDCFQALQKYGGVLICEQPLTKKQETLLGKMSQPVNS